MSPLSMLGAMASFQCWFSLYISFWETGLHFKDTWPNSANMFNSGMTNRYIFWTWVSIPEHQKKENYWERERIDPGFLFELIENSFVLCLTLPFKMQMQYSWMQREAQYNVWIIPWWRSSLRIDCLIQLRSWVAMKLCSYNVKQCMMLPFCW